MAVVDVRETILVKGHGAGAFESTVIARDADAIDAQGQRDSPEEIGHEHERAIQHRNDRKFLPRVIGSDSLREFVQAAEDRLFVNKDAFDVVDHDEPVETRRHEEHKGGDGIFLIILILIFITLANDDDEDMA
jgi:hypothetical protein